MFRLNPTKILQLVLLGITLLLPTAESKAVTLGSGTYDLVNGSTFTLFLAGNGTTLTFSGTYRAGSTLTIGNQSGNLFDTVGSLGTIDFVISEGGVQKGTATGTLTTQWANVAYNAGGNVAAGDLGQVSGGGLFFNVAGMLNGQNFNLTSALEQKFANVALGQIGGKYDNVINSFGNQFSLALGNIGVNTNDAFKAWLMGNTVLLGNSYVINADIHAGISQVPEPATVGLLSMGLLGGALRRRKQK